MKHVQTIQAIYAAFRRGDVATILECLAETVQWEYGASSTTIPWLQPRRGRAAVRKFFEALNGLELVRFEPNAFLQSGTLVVALIQVEAVVKATGRRFVEDDEVHIWHFDGDGRIARFRHRVDTLQQWLACEP